jgi:hypothetical protein
MLALNVDRSELLTPMRCECWLPATGKPGKVASRLLSVSGVASHFW